MTAGTTGSTTPGSAEGGTICTGCGTPDCTGCGRALDPPRFCPHCGRRMTVAVTPAGYRARCRDHGQLTA